MAFDFGATEKQRPDNKGEVLIAMVRSILEVKPTRIGLLQIILRIYVFLIGGLVAKLLNWK